MHSFALKQSLKSMNLSTRHFVDPPNTGIRWVILGLRGERARARALERERERERETATAGKQTRALIGASELIVTKH